TAFVKQCVVADDVSILSLLEVSTVFMVQTCKEICRMAVMRLVRLAKNRLEITMIGNPVAFRVPCHDTDAAVIEQSFQRLTVRMHPIRMHPINGNSGFSSPVESRNRTSYRRQQAHSVT